MPPVVDEILLLVGRERHEEALGLKPDCSARDIDAALVRASVEHQGNARVRAALNKAAAVLRTEVAGSDRRTKMQARRVRSYQAAARAAAENSEWDVAVEHLEAALEFASDHDRVDVCRNLAAVLNNRAVQQIQEGTKLLADETKGILERAVQGR